MEFSFTVSEDRTSAVIPSWGAQVRYIPSADDPLGPYKRSATYTLWFGTDVKGRTAEIEMPKGTFLFKQLGDDFVQGRFIAGTMARGTWWFSTYDSYDVKDWEKWKCVGTWTAVCDNIKGTHLARL
jgi:hypothetical protein